MTTTLQVSAPGATSETGPREQVFGLTGVDVRYSGNLAVEGVDMELYKNDITAFIGPSGCGKSTLLRCLNRMNDLIPGATVSGEVLYHGENLYAPYVDAVQVRKRIGMVFQKPQSRSRSRSSRTWSFGPKVLGIEGPELDADRPS
jgi:phosphate transport system ATP-binding protein